MLLAWFTNKAPTFLNASSKRESPMIWAEESFLGHSGLLPVDGNLNFKQCGSLLAVHLHSMAADAFGKFSPWIFQLDMAPTHCSVYTFYLLSAQEVICLKRSTKSPVSSKKSRVWCIVGPTISESSLNVVMSWAKTFAMFGSIWTPATFLVYIISSPANFWLQMTVAEERQKTNLFICYRCTMWTLTSMEKSSIPWPVWAGFVSGVAILIPVWSFVTRWTNVFV